MEYTKVQKLEVWSVNVEYLRQGDKSLYFTEVESSQERAEELAKMYRDKGLATSRVAPPFNDEEQYSFIVTLGVKPDRMAIIDAWLKVQHQLSEEDFLESVWIDYNEHIDYCYVQDDEVDGISELSEEEMDWVNADLETSLAIYLYEEEEVYEEEDDDDEYEE